MASSSANRGRAFAARPRRGFVRSDAFVVRLRQTSRDAFVTGRGGWPSYPDGLSLKQYIRGLVPSPSRRFTV
jgi:hypothetical protein